MANGVVNITDETFEAEVLKSSEPVLVDFWAPWCGPCLRVGPIVEELSSENAGKAKIVKVDIDECPQTAEAFGVSSIPTLILFKGGEEKDRVIGAQPKAVLQNLIDSNS
ncbi:MAG: thioredoxin [Sumerlaeia bacterium]